MVPMALLGRIRWRLALAIAASAILPLLAATVLAGNIVRRTAERFYVPEIGARLDQSLGLYQELASAIKASMRHAADAIACRDSLKRAVKAHHETTIREELVQIIGEYPALVELSVEDDQGHVLASANRGRPVDRAREKQLELMRPLESEAPASLTVRLLFATDRARLDELASMGQFVESYRRIEQRRVQDERAYVSSFAVLLALTVLVAAGVGLWVARGPTVRLLTTATALKRVGEGDFSVRVPEAGRDEITDLARAFNRMVGEIESSRARIEYLQRIGAWQEMARRLAHEIKNPLTPILLAVQEVHRRCPDVPAFRQLVDETLGIVQDEVETLRRLVSEFSDFARMPQAQLQLADLAEFFRAQQRHFELLDEESGELEHTPSGTAEPQRDLRIQVESPEGAAPARFDAQMLTRAIVNLVRNAVQAITLANIKPGRITIRLRDAISSWVIDVQDNGPGIAEDLRQVIFDPYVTTKKTGTGLGLAIVKKIVVEHEGTILVESPQGGGTRIRIDLPKPDASQPPRSSPSTASIAIPVSRGVWPTPEPDPGSEPGADP